MKENIPRAAGLEKLPCHVDFSHIILECLGKIHERRKDGWGYSYFHLYRCMSCSICGTGELGDEIHYIMHCPVFQQDREKFLPIIENEKTQTNFVKLLKSDDIKLLRGLAKFLKILFEVFE